MEDIIPGQKRRRTESMSKALSQGMEIISQPVSQVTRQVLRARPMRKRRTNRYNSVNYFKRTVQLNDIVLDNTNPYFSALNFSLADVPAVAEFQNLYDWYKITGVRIRPFLWSR